jgi:cytochrome P450
MQVHDGILTDDQVRDQCWTLLETGYETLGLVLGWLWYLLAQNSNAQTTVATELESVLVNQPPTAANVSKLKFLNLALSETMRLYPPTWIFVRVPLQPDVLPTGTYIPAGTKLYLSPYVSHRLPRYFPDPDRFDPDRFAEPVQSTRPRLAYYPFSAGQRVCLGQGMALMEAPLIAATVAQRFSFAPGRPVAVEPGLTLAARNGISLHIQKR